MSQCSDMLDVLCRIPGILEELPYVDSATILPNPLILGVADGTTAVYDLGAVMPEYQKNLIPYRELAEDVRETLNNRFNPFRLLQYPTSSLHTKYHPTADALAIYSINFNYKITAKANKAMCLCEAPGGWAKYFSIQFPEVTVMSEVTSQPWLEVPHGLLTGDGTGDITENVDWLIASTVADFDIVTSDGPTAETARAAVAIMAAVLRPAVPIPIAEDPAAVRTTSALPHVYQAGGHFVLRLDDYEPYDFIPGLVACFRSVTVFKPCLIEADSSTRYLICLDYQGNYKQLPYTSLLTQWLSYVDGQHCARQTAFLQRCLDARSIVRTEDFRDLSRCMLYIGLDGTCPIRVY
jgi:23S rRNA U2552 (ribose-2'-O)-methylase RlmE/FtsJ